MAGKQKIGEVLAVQYSYKCSEEVTESIEPKKFLLEQLIISNMLKERVYAIDKYLC